MKTLAVIGVSFFLSMQMQAQNALTFYVAPDGQAGNPGTLDKPFQRPEQALQAASAAKSAKNITVYIRGGNYSFSKTLAYSDDSPDDSRYVLISAYQNEKVYFTGAKKLDNSKFVVVSDAAVLNRLPAAARGKVYQVDLKAQQVNDLGRLAPHGYKNILPAPMELFYNEKTLPLARYPNDGYLPIGKVTDPGSKTENRAASFTMDDPHIKNWQAANAAWVCGFLSYGYSDDNLKVASFDPSARVIHLKDQGLYGVYSNDDVSTDILKNSRSLRGFYVYNLLEELDAPGEWYVDEATGTLYLWPADNSIATADIEVSMLRGPIMSLTNTANVGIKGINFAYGRTSGLTLESTKHTVISGCTFNGLGTVGISAIPTKEHPADNTDLLVQSCTIHHTGTGGIMLVAGDRKQQVAANDIIDNCSIYSFSRRNMTFAPAVSVNGVGNKITHCDIHDAPDQAIAFYGNDLDIEYNHIYNVVQHMTDAGGVGTGRDPSTIGNTISNNFFDNIMGNGNVSVAAIYLDDGTSGTEVDGNIFYKCGSPGTYSFGAVHVNGGTENHFRNNTFIECHQAYSNTQWNDKDWKDVISNPNKRFFADVDMRSDAFTRKYPYLKKIDDTVNLVQRQNYSYNTLTYKVDVLSSGASYVHKNVVNTNSDPGFADARNKNFGLTTPPSALQQAGDWKPTPFAQIGRQEK